MILKQSSAQRFKLEVADTGHVTGYASIFGNIDSYGERVLPGAYAASLARHRSEGSAPIMLWQHDTAEPVGRWVDVREDDIGLRVTGNFNLKTTRGQDAFQHVAAGDLDGLSVGYTEVVAGTNGQVRELRELDLREVSIVSMPANRRARITGVKAESAADIERILREGGLPRVYATRFAQAGWAAMSGHDHQKATAFADLIDRATAELRSI